MPFSAAAPTSPAEVNEAIAALSARLGALRDEGLALEGELDTAFSSESLSRCAAMVAAQTRIAAVARRTRARRTAARLRADAALATAVTAATVASWDFQEEVKPVPHEDDDFAAMSCLAPLALLFCGDTGLANDVASHLAGDERALFAPKPVVVFERYSHDTRALFHEHGQRHRRWGARPERGAGPEAEHRAFGQ